MKYLINTLLCLAVAASVAFPSFAQNRADRQSLEDPESFSMILLGDPQGYIKYDLNQPLFELCTAWIADNADQLNIKGVLCTGDGWLRILEFCPDGRAVKVKTYSPLFGISHLTKHLAHRNDPCDRFEMVLE